MEALLAVAIMLIVLIGVIHFMTYMELKRFVDQMCKPMPAPQMMSYGPPPSRKSAPPPHEDPEPMGFAAPPKKKEKTNGN